MTVVRVCGAIVRSGSILMVFHRDGARSYWTLPGGGVEAEETPEQAVSREVWEETGLRAVPTRFLFDEGFGSGVCRCFLMDANETDTAALGYDPEESHLQPEARMLQGIGWHTLQSKQDDAQVAKVIRLLENS